jgi:asparagine synthase (glutamine-hydrolysing)
MCGIAGLMRVGGLRSPADRELIDRMIARLHHRGPDGMGIWADSGAGIVFGHRRLAVLELSAAGEQPMVSASGRFVLTFNGEIYNHLEMRVMLAQAGESVAWRGHSDTESLLACVDAWGIEETLKRATGMFALALWDRRDRMVTLARDRAGEKPLYYGWFNNAFMFGSELKALYANPDFQMQVDRNALAQYVRRGFIQTPQTIYRGIFKLPAGSWLQLPADGQSGTLPSVAAYWRLKDVVARGSSRPFAGGDSEAISCLESHLMRSVGLQSVADVPLGAFLSGGIDSSVVVAMMQAQAAQPVRTFTIGFSEDSHNEAKYAQQVARHLGTNHTELYVTPDEAAQVIPSLPMLYDEPFGDSSAIPTILVSRLARRDVTVSLSGDGGDELFGGYARYARASRAWSLMGYIPRSARKMAAHGLKSLFSERPDSRIGWKSRRLALYLEANSAAACYQTNISQFGDSPELVLGADRLSAKSEWAELDRVPRHSYSEMMYADFMAYLPDDILTKVDRASMSVSLECRVPMLDHQLIEFAWTLPFHMKMRGGRTKWLLRQLLRKYVPDELIDRPKMGFGVPVAEWLRGPLRDWAEELLSADRLRQEGFLNPKIVRGTWLRHLAKLSNEGDALWHILMFQAWLQNRTKDLSGLVSP